MKPIVLITGVSGRIGTKIAERLSPQYEIIGLDLAPLPEPISGVNYIKTDLSSDESVRLVFTKIKERYGTQIASCIHLAAYYNFTGGKWEQYESITIGGTRRIIEELRKFQLEQFIFSSTMLVYVPCKLNEKIDEKWPIDPKWEYPLSKVKTEELLKEKHGNSSLLLLRIAGVYDDFCHSIPISNQIERIYHKKLESHFYPGHLSHGSAFIHMEDLVALLALSVERRKELPKEEVLVVGEEVTMSYREMQEALGQLIHNKSWVTIRIPKWIAKCGAYVMGKKSFIRPWMIDLADDHYALNTERARLLLGWRSKHSLMESLPFMIAALKKDPPSWFKAHGFSYD